MNANNSAVVVVSFAECWSCAVNAKRARTQPERLTQLPYPKGLFSKSLVRQHPPQTCTRNEKNQPLSQRRRDRFHANTYNDFITDTQNIRTNHTHTMPHHDPKTTIHPLLPIIEFKVSNLIIIIGAKTFPARRWLWFVNFKY